MTTLMETIIVMVGITILFIVPIVWQKVKAWKNNEKYLQEMENMQIQNDKITDVMIEQYGKRYRIHLLKGPNWKICETIDDLKDIYAGNYAYPFRNKRIADEVANEIIQAIKK